MNYVITTGRSVDEAVEDALKKLKLKKRGCNCRSSTRSFQRFLRIWTKGRCS